MVTTYDRSSLTRRYIMPILSFSHGNEEVEVEVTWADDLVPSPISVYLVRTAAVV